MPYRGVLSFCQKQGRHRNVQIEVRFTGGGPDRNQPLAKELVSLQPDIILAHTTVAARALQRETVTIPIIFVNVSDPMGAGFVASLARPGGNLYRHSALAKSGIVGSGWLCSRRLPRA